MGNADSKGRATNTKSSVSAGDMKSDDLRALQGRCLPKGLKVESKEPQLVAGSPVAVAPPPSIGAQPIVDLALSMVADQANQNAGLGYGRPVAPMAAVQQNGLQHSSSMILTEHSKILTEPQQAPQPTQGLPSGTMQRCDSLMRTSPQHAVVMQSAQRPGVLPRSDSMVMASGQQVGRMARPSVMQRSDSMVRASGALQRSDSMVRASAQQVGTLQRSDSMVRASAQQVGTLQRSDSMVRASAQQGFQRSDSMVRASAQQASALQQQPAPLQQQPAPMQQPDPMTRTMRSMPQCALQQQPAPMQQSDPMARTIRAVPQSEPMARVGAMQQSDPMGRTVPQREMPGSMIMPAGGLRQVLIQKAAQREMLAQSTPVYLCGPSAGPMQGQATMVHPSAHFAQVHNVQRAVQPLVHPSAPQQVLLGFGCPPPVVSAGANQLSDSMVHAYEAPAALADPIVNGTFQRSDSLLRSSARLEAMLKAPRPSAGPEPTPGMGYYGEAATGMQPANHFVWDNLGGSRLAPQAATVQRGVHLQQPNPQALPASSAILAIESLGSGPTTRGVPTHHPELASNSNSPPLAWQQAVEQAIQAGLLPPPAATLQQMRANDVYERGLAAFPTVG